jgi:hypothetical protein
MVMLKGSQKVTLCTRKTENKINHKQRRSFLKPLRNVFAFQNSLISYWPE